MLRIIILITFVFISSSATAINDIEKAEKHLIKGEVESALDVLSNSGTGLAYENLGYLYYGRLGINKDHKKVNYWFSKAVEQYKKENTPQGNYRLGIIYNNGWSTEGTDKEIAKKYLKSAAYNGIGAAAGELATIYSGYGSGADESEQLYWAIHGAKLDDPFSQWQVYNSIRYWDDKKSKDKAFKMLVLAAKGRPYMYAKTLADEYRYGRLTQENKLKYEEWMTVYESTKTRKPILRHPVNIKEL